MHGKERVLDRPLRLGLGLQLRIASLVNTDAFGTFSGDVARPADALATCRLKALAGMDALDIDLGIASEGSFGPHPYVPMLAVGMECLVMVDRRSGRIFEEQALCTQTNFSSTAVTDYAAAQAWLDQVGFPSHAVMVRPHGREPMEAAAWLAKGVHHAADLAALVAEAVSRSVVGQAWLETDMRAHCNPTRMASIRGLAFQLVRRVRRICPQCAAPGFGPTDTVPGLPCADCGLASRWVARQLWSCDICDYSEQRSRPDGLLALDPMYCDYCNP